MLDRLPKGRHHIFPHLLDEFARECTLVRDDSVTLQGLNVGIYADEKSVFSASVRCHGHAIFWMRAFGQPSTCLHSGDLVASSGDLVANPK
jgi:hypothetical protein